MNEWINKYVSVNKKYEYIDKAMKELINEQKYEWINK